MFKETAQSFSNMQDQQQSLLRLREKYMQNVSLYQPAFMIKQKYKQSKNPFHKILNCKNLSKSLIVEEENSLNTYSYDESMEYDKMNPLLNVGSAEDLNNPLRESRFNSSNISVHE